MPDLIVVRRIFGKRDNFASVFDDFINDNGEAILSLLLVASWFLHVKIFLMVSDHSKSNIGGA